MSHPARTGYLAAKERKICLVCERSIDTCPDWQKCYDLWCDKDVKGSGRECPLCKRPVSFKTKLQHGTTCRADLAAIVNTMENPPPALAPDVTGRTPVQPTNNATNQESRQRAIAQVAEDYWRTRKCPCCRDSNKGPAHWEECYTHRYVLPRWTGRRLCPLCREEIAAEQAAKHAGSCMASFEIIWEQLRAGTQSTTDNASRVPTGKPKARSRGGARGNRGHDGVKDKSTQTEPVQVAIDELTPWLIDYRNIGGPGMSAAIKKRIAARWFMLQRELELVLGEGSTVEPEEESLLINLIELDTPESSTPEAADTINLELAEVFKITAASTSDTESDDGKGVYSDTPSHSSQDSQEWTYGQHRKLRSETPVERESPSPSAAEVSVAETRDASPVSQASESDGENGPAPTSSPAVGEDETTSKQQQQGTTDEYLQAVVEKFKVDLGFK